MFQPADEFSVDTACMSFTEKVEMNNSAPLHAKTSQDMFKNCQEHTLPIDGSVRNCSTGYKTKTAGENNEPGSNHVVNAFTVGSTPATPSLLCDAPAVPVIGEGHDSTCLTTVSTPTPNGLPQWLPVDRGGAPLSPSITSDDTPPLELLEGLLRQQYNRGFAGAGGRSSGAPNLSARNNVWKKEMSKWPSYSSLHSNASTPTSHYRRRGTSQRDHSGLPVSPATRAFPASDRLSQAPSPSSGGLGIFANNPFPLPTTPSESGSMLSMVMDSGIAGPESESTRSSRYTGFSAVVQSYNEKNGRPRTNNTMKPKETGGALDFMSLIAFSKTAESAEGEYCDRASPLWDTCGDTTRLLQSLKGNVANLARVEVGSKFLQQQLSTGNESLISFVAAEVELCVASLAMDLYGNYLVQTLVRVCNTEQRKRILMTMAPYAFEISKDRRGTHTLQAAIATISSIDEEVLLVWHVRDKILEMAVDAHATHALQKMILSFHVPQVSQLLEVCVPHLPVLAHHPLGTCVIQRCITIAHRHPGLIVFREAIHFLLKTNAILLMHSPFGNYTIQHALNEWGGEICRPIVQVAKRRLISASCMRFSSNVIEKCIEKAPSEDVAEMVDVLSEWRSISKLIQSQFGNFVIQKALTVATTDQIQKIAIGVCACLMTGAMRRKWQRILLNAVQKVPGWTLNDCSKRAAVVATQIEHELSQEKQQNPLLLPIPRAGDNLYFDTAEPSSDLTPSLSSGFGGDFQKLIASLNPSDSPVNATTSVPDLMEPEGFPMTLTPTSSNESCCSANGQEFTSILRDFLTRLPVAVGNSDEARGSDFSPMAKTPESEASPCGFPFIHSEAVSSVAAPSSKDGKSVYPWNEQQLISEPFKPRRPSSQ